jgi:hypothetical protein
LNFIDRLFFKKARKGKNMIVNISTDRKYLTQRDNEVRPHETCAPTSMVMGLHYSNVEFPHKDGVQPEDDLTTFTATDPGVINFYKNNSEAWIRRAYLAGTHGNEIHSVLSYGTNKWAGKEVTNFTWNSSVQAIIANLLKGKACVLSGRFPYLNKKGEIIEIGHVVCAVGFETEQDGVREDNIDVSKIKHIIIDDPYGNYRSLYQDKNGNDVMMPYADFVKYIRECGKVMKWSHFIE